MVSGTWEGKGHLKSHGCQEGSEFGIPGYICIYCKQVVVPSFLSPRISTVGLTSRMGQWKPDGISVGVKVQRNLGGCEHRVLSFQPISLFLNDFSKSNVQKEQ